MSLNARMYDPIIARFLQEDTYTGNINDPLSLNLYVYCNNNPLVYHDPTGHFGTTTGNGVPYEILHPDKSSKGTSSWNNGVPKEIQDKQNKSSSTGNTGTSTWNNGVPKGIQNKTNKSNTGKSGTGTSSWNNGVPKVIQDKIDKNLKSIDNSIQKSIVLNYQENYNGGQNKETLGGLFGGWLDPNKLADMTKNDIIKEIPNEWTYTDFNNRVHIRDTNGSVRMRLDPPDTKTPYNHTHLYDENKNPLNKDLEKADKRSKDVHHKYKGPDNDNDDDNPRTAGTGEISSQPDTSGDEDSKSIIDKISITTGLTGTALVIYLIVSEGSRLFPPRNLIPVP